MPVLQDDYSITLEAFKGPLDLLLFLIRRAEVEITDIPIAEITDQYLAFLGRIEDIDIDLAGEFLVMAATLVEIKARVLQHRRERKEGAAGGPGNPADLATGDAGLDLDRADPRYELIQQLLAYQKYRIAAEDLEHRREEFENRFAAQPARHDLRVDQPTEESSDAFELDIEDAHIFDLFEAYERIVASVDFSRLGEHEVQDDDTPIGLHQEDLVDRMQRAVDRRISLQEAWLGRRKIDVIGLFLATLELVRQRRIIVVQDEINGEIMLQLNEDPQQIGDSGPLKQAAAGPDESL
jgi:segregation and condensation protein A